MSQPKTTLLQNPWNSQKIAHLHTLTSCLELPSSRPAWASPKERQEAWPGVLTWVGELVYVCVAPVCAPLTLVCAPSRHRSGFSCKNHLCEWEGSENVAGPLQDWFT